MISRVCIRVCVVCTCSRKKWGTVEIRKRITQGGGLPRLRCPFQFPDFRSLRHPSPPFSLLGEDSTTLGGCSVTVHRLRED